jgi:hypothetical protein
MPAEGKQRGRWFACTDENEVEEPVLRSRASNFGGFVIGELGYLYACVMCEGRQYTDSSTAIRECIRSLNMLPLATTQMEPASVVVITA